MTAKNKLLNLLLPQKFKGLRQLPHNMCLLPILFYKISFYNLILGSSKNKMDTKIEPSETSFVTLWMCVCVQPIFRDELSYVLFFSFFPQIAAK